MSETGVNLPAFYDFLRRRRESRVDSQTADLLVACAEHNIYSRGDLELRLGKRVLGEPVPDLPSPMKRSP